MDDGLQSIESDAAIAWLRQVSPYFRNHRGRVFVVYLDSDAVLDSGFGERMRDLVLLAAVGIRLVIVFSATGQVNARLKERGIQLQRVGDAQVIDADCMREIRDVVGGQRLALESAFSFSSRGGPVASSPSRIASGNFVRARSAGVIDGIDVGFFGVLRSIDKAAIGARLERDEVVLLAPIGFSPTGELFSLKPLDLAVEVATQIDAAKLVMISRTEGITGLDGTMLRQLTTDDARHLHEAGRNDQSEKKLLEHAIQACEKGVERVHVIGSQHDGAILRELFTRDGIGTMLSTAPFDLIRAAGTDDIAAIFDLVAPLQEQGVLLERSREQLDDEIDRFFVMERERTVVACGALHPYANHRTAEIACVAVHHDYRGSSFGDALLDSLERRATEAGLGSVFVLTTQASQWFNERGYQAGTIEQLPIEKRELYNYQRNSAVLVKTLRELA